MSCGNNIVCLQLIEQEKLIIKVVKQKIYIQQRLHVAWKHYDDEGFELEPHQFDVENVLYNSYFMLDKVYFGYEPCIENMIWQNEKFV